MRNLIAAALLPGLLLTNEPAAAQSTLDVGDAKINYLVEGSGPAVVLIHGWALNLREWDDQIAALSPHYRVVAYDRRGYGKSIGFADPTADPGDLRRLLDTLGIRSAVLVGHSAGPDVAERFAAAMPERVDGLVLYGGGEPADFPVPRERPGVRERHTHRAALWAGFGLQAGPEPAPVPAQSPGGRRRWRPGWTR